MGDITFSCFKVSVINVISGAITCANPGLWGSLRSLTVRPKLLKQTKNKEAKRNKIHLTTTYNTAETPHVGPKPAKQRKKLTKKNHGFEAARNK